MTKQELPCAVEKHGFGICHREIEAWLQDEVLLLPSESEYDLPAGGTKQGGEPDLPLGVVWPKYSRRGVPGLRNTSKPMTFLVQLRCSDLRPFAPPQFPDHGLLSFFIAIEQNEWVRDENERLLGNVLYTSGRTELLTRSPFPHGLYFGNRLPVSSLKIKSSVGISLDSLHEAIEIHFDDSQEIRDRIWDFYRQELIPTGCHKLFGPPSTLELDIIAEVCLMAKIDGQPESDTNHRTNSDWLLLLEFDPTDLPVDDDGRLYFMIRRDDLVACRFDMAYLLHDRIV